MKLLSTALITTLLSALLVACGGGFEVNTEAPAKNQASAPRAGESFSGNGWYWKFDEPGTGIMIEAQGGRGFMAIFTYEENGRPTWYTGEGSFQATMTGFDFNGTLNRYQGGMQLPTKPSAVPRATVVGSLTAKFTGSGHSTRVALNLPDGRTWNLRRFDFNGLGAGPTGQQPEVGWYWDPDVVGRGYAVEIQGDRMFAAVFHYDAVGQPSWNTIESGITNGKLDDTNFYQYEGGETLTSGYKAPRLPSVVGDVQFSVSQPCEISAKLPRSESWTRLIRFSFGTDRPCRAANG